MHKKVEKQISQFINMRNNKKGFTLIELLVVIAIIGLLSSIVLVSLGPARKKARDARRQSDIRQIVTAMEMCLDDSGCGNGGYAAVTAASGRITGIGASTNFATYLSPLPSDPGGGTAGCTDTGSSEMAAGQYCGFASGAGASTYCIFARLSNGTWITASAKGAQTMTTAPAAGACP